MEIGYWSSNMTSLGLGIQIIQLWKLCNSISTLKKGLPAKPGASSEELSEERVKGKVSHRKVCPQAKALSFQLNKPDLRQTTLQPLKQLQKVWSGLSGLLSSTATVRKQASPSWIF